MMINSNKTTPSGLFFCKKNMIKTTKLVRNNLNIKTQKQVEKTVIYIHNKIPVWKEH